MKIVGVDPGLRGAAATLEYFAPQELPEFFDLPHVPGTRVLDAVAFHHFLLATAPSLVVLEHVQGRPFQNLKANEQAAYNFGRLTAACDLAGVKWSTVRPAVWHKAMTQGLKEPHPKTKALRACERHWPEHDWTLEHDGRRDAALLALWCFLFERVQAS